MLPWDLRDVSPEAGNRGATVPVSTSEIFTPTPVSVVVVTGAVTAGEILGAALNLLRNDPHPLVLWDGADADVSGLSLNDLYPLFFSVKPFLDSRKGGRTAILAGSTAGFGMARWVTTMAENWKFPYPIRAFKARDAAMEWLREDVGTEGASSGTGVA